MGQIRQGVYHKVLTEFKKTGASRAIYNAGRPGASDRILQNTASTRSWDIIHLGNALPWKVARNGNIGGLGSEITDAASDRNDHLRAILCPDTGARCWNVTRNGNIGDLGNGITDATTV